VRSIERATRAELRAMNADLASNALARTAVDLAQRLDCEPTDRDAVLLSRELRLVLTDLHARHDGVGGEIDAFLAGIAAADLRQPGD
jgi:hypothetical protein